MKSNSNSSFKTSLHLSEKLNELGFVKLFKEGDVILNENEFLQT